MKVEITLGGKHLGSVEGDVNLADAVIKFCEAALNYLGEKDRNDEAKGAE